MKSNKMPAPRRAGTPYTVSERKAREAEIAQGMERLRLEAPEEFARLLRVLARLAVSSRPKEK